MDCSRSASLTQQQQKHLSEQSAGNPCKGKFGSKTVPASCVEMFTVIPALHLAVFSYYISVVLIPVSSKD